MRRAAILFAVLLTLTSCSGGALSLLTGGGPKVAANGQLGETNTQTIGTTKVTEQSADNATADKVSVSSDEVGVKVDEVTTVVVNEVPPWMIWMFGLLMGFVLPSHREIARNVTDWIGKKRKAPTK